MSETRANYLKGISFGMVTCLLWGILPVMLKIALDDFSSSTIIWFRFFFSFFVLLVYLTWLKKKPFTIITRPPTLGLLAGVCLAANYYYFMIGLELSGPSNTAVVIQIAPLLVVIAGTVLFKERFDKGKQFGLFLAITGFIGFYFDQRSHSINPDQYFIANGNIVFSAIVWAIYAVAMKRLTGKYEAQNLNFLVYGLAAVVLIPGTQWTELAKADGVGWLLLVLLGLNTVLAYGSLLEALKYIPLSHISMITALNPFVTMTTMAIVSWFGFTEPEKITTLGYAGATLAISGVAWVVGK
jgi:drug/metabolite transporter (DMT)-like permease